MNDNKKLSKSKSTEFSTADVYLAELCKALSHPARIAILRALAERDECVCGEIVEVLPLAQSTVSQHLKQLRANRLIRGEVDGVKSCYCIDRKQLKQFFALISKLEKKMEESMAKAGNCC